MILQRRTHARPAAPRDVLLVGHNRRRITRLAAALERYAFDVQTIVCTAASAALRLPARPPRVIVADALPPVTARHVDLLFQLRQRWERVPLIAVTACDDASVLTGLLAIGVDEFASFSSPPADLVVRLRRQLQGARVAAGENAYGTSGLGCDVVRHTVRANGRSVQLTTREFQLYSCLAGRPNAPVSVDVIVRNVWGERATRPGLAGPVGVYVFHLRRKLAKLGFGDAVRTVRGKGYMLLDGGSRQSAPRRRRTRA
jgi:DNA-binding response OmpR family regulator